MRICLNMIVRNEEHCIERALNSTLPHVDCAVICDTGSTDATVEIMERVAAAHKVPLTVTHASFVDFSQARNAALDGVLEHEPDADYALLCDADMELEVEDPQWRQQLATDATHFRVEQYNASCVYWNTRVVKMAANPRYVGVTHEYVSVPGQLGTLFGLRYRDHIDGSNRAQKTERDVALLSAGIATAEGGMTLRYLFYLAQTYYYAGNLKAAAKLYEARALLPPQNAEQWYALYMAGRTNMLISDMHVQRGLELLQQAAAMAPHRAEPKIILSDWCCAHEFHAEATRHAEAAVALPLPHAEIFVEKPMYREYALARLQAAAYYVNRPELGYLAANLLWSRKGVAGDLHALTRRNYGWYAPQLIQLLPEGRTAMLDIQLEDKQYAPCNPTVLIRKNGQRMGIMRHVNYRIGPATYPQYHIVNGLGMPDEDTPVRTQNTLVWFDEDWQPTKTQLITAVPGCIPDVKRRISGVEDMRLFECAGELWVSANSYMWSSEMAPQVVIMHMDENGQLTRAINPEQPPDRIEKNWMPLIGQPFEFVYRVDPLLVFRVEPTGALQKIALEHQPHSTFGLPGACGSSQWVRYKDGWLGVIHQHGVTNTHGVDYRAYYHRFIELDAHYHVRRASPMFTFHGAAVEFCAGLTIDGDELIVPYAIWDRAAHMFRCPLAAVDNVLLDLDQLSWCDEVGITPESERYAWAKTVLRPRQDYDIE